MIVVAAGEVGFRVFRSCIASAVRHKCREAAPRSSTRAKPRSRGGDVKGGPLPKPHVVEASGVEDAHVHCRPAEPQRVGKDRLRSGRENLSDGSVDEATTVATVLDTREHFHSFQLQDRLLTNLSEMLPTVATDGRRCTIDTRERPLIPITRQIIADENTR